MYLLPGAYVVQTQVAPRRDPSKKEKKELLFVRHYCASADEQPERALSLRHLEWECIDSSQGRSRRQQAHFGVVECSCVLQRASIFPHFSLSGMKANSTTPWF